MGVRVSGHLLDGRDLVERRSQDVEPVLEQVKRLRSNGMVGSSEMRHAARIPLIEIEKYLALTGITMHEFMANPVHIKAMLNNPDLSEYRVWTGRV